MEARVLLFNQVRSLREVTLQLHHTLPQGIRKRPRFIVKHQRHTLSMIQFFRIIEIKHQEIDWGGQKGRP